VWLLLFLLLSMEGSTDPSASQATMRLEKERTGDEVSVFKEKARVSKGEQKNSILQNTGGHSEESALTGT